MLNVPQNGQSPYRVSEVLNCCLHFMQKYMTYSFILVPPVGFEPTIRSNLELTGYKPAVLPLNYRGLILDIPGTPSSQQSRVANFSVLTGDTICRAPGHEYSRKIVVV